jgi:uracil-DNA glycosylase family 4
MFKALGLGAGAVPASNLIFVRSRREGTLAGDASELADACWPFHQFLIESLKPRVIVCLGKTVGDYVRAKTAGHRVSATFTEQNERKWQSMSYAANGLKVVVVTHPSIADWTKRHTDPTPLIASALHDG